MSFCKNCGSSIQSQQTFCNQCGEKNNTQPQPQTRAASKTNFSLSAPLKWAIVGLFTLAVGLFAAHIVLSNQYKPEKVVEHFENAVNQHDYQSLRKIFEQGGTESSLADEELKGYITFLTK